VKIGYVCPLLLPHQPKMAANNFDMKLDAIFAKFKKLQGVNNLIVEF